MSYARARLWNGIAGVGTVVVLAVLALALNWPGALLPENGSSLTRDVAAIGAVLMLHAVLLAPFDFMGGYLLPKRYERPVLRFPSFLAEWLRAVIAQAAVLLGVAAALLLAGRVGGLPAAAAAFLIAMILLVAGQRRVATFVAGLTGSDRDPEVTTVEALDPGFTGGIIGLPGRERFVVPSHWAELLGEDGLRAQLARWRAARDTGGRLLGLMVAMGWNLTGFLIASLLPRADVTTAAGLVTLALGFTLWCFLGLLVLPSLSRPAVFAADRRARERGAGVELLGRTLERLDREQDDEPERAPGVEAIFHPVPALSRRLSGLQSDSGASVGAWHAARTALYLSWAGLGLLARAVHCNAGRPELWTMPPCD